MSSRIAVVVLGLLGTSFVHGQTFHGATQPANPFGEPLNEVGIDVELHRHGWTATGGNFEEFQNVTCPLGYQAFVARHNFIPSLTTPPWLRYEHINTMLPHNPNVELFQNALTIPTAHIFGSSVEGVTINTEDDHIYVTGWLRIVWGHNNELVGSTSAFVLELNPANGAIINDFYFGVNPPAPPPADFLNCIQSAVQDCEDCDSYELFGIAVNEEGDVYVTGRWLPSGQSDWDIFTARLIHDPFTNLLVLDWQATAGGAGDDSGHEIDVDSDDRAFVTGGFFASANFEGTIVTGALTEMFVARYGANPQVPQVEVVIADGGDLHDRGWGLAVDHDDNVLVTGEFEDVNASFGGIVIHNVAFGGPGAEVFLAKYDASLIVQWARVAADASVEAGSAVDTDLANAPYITGYFTGDDLDFLDPTYTMSLGQVTNSGGSDLFLAKYDAAGNFIWATRAGDAGPNDDTVALGLSVLEQPLTSLTQPKLSACGWFEDTIVFGPGIGNLLNAAGAADAFTAAYRD